FALRTGSVSWVNWDRSTAMRSSARAAAHSSPQSPAARINQREVGPSTAILSLLMLQLARQNADALPRLKPLVFAVTLVQAQKLFVCGHRLRLPPQFIVAGGADEPRTCAGRFTPVELVEYLERGLIALAEIVHRHQVAQCVGPVAIELQGLPQFALGGREIPLLEAHAAQSRVQVSGEFRRRGLQLVLGPQAFRQPQSRGSGVAAERQRFAELGLCLGRAIGAE